jgi:hypothetical protein
MITPYHADEGGAVVRCQPPPFNYTEDGPYTRQLLLNAVVVVVFAVLAVMAGLPLVGISV